VSPTVPWWYSSVRIVPVPPTWSPPFVVTSTSYPDTVLANVKFTAPQAGTSTEQSTLRQLTASNGGLTRSDLNGLPISDTRTIYFNEDPNAGTFAINMQPQVQTTETPLPPVMVPNGQTTAQGRWTIANTTLESHDFHIHINPFLVLAVSDPNAPCPNSLVPYNAYSNEDVLNLPQAQPTATAVQCNGDPAPTTLHFGRIVFLTQWKDFFGQFVGDPPPTRRPRVPGTSAGVRLRRRSSGAWLPSPGTRW
jgi:hypothetical protein